MSNSSGTRMQTATTEGQKDQANHGKLPQGLLVVVVVVGVICGGRWGCGCGGRHGYSCSGEISDGDGGSNERG
ncbi:hypothetical protein PoB_006003700 [Plakobranchus ocellatus]|uniref:Uncharacterized protein n=1 Tax=Plakobranchus ocellatus TaxID=259542 RepID=A0AAV4CNU2_9GAST|nr:hypothetical protein PoB_006003700 [Plakobranchus ocellatus]